MILDLVENNEDQAETRNSLEESTMEDIPYFKLCGHHKNEICIEDQEKRLYYNTKHEIFIRFFI